MAKNARELKANAKQLGFTYLGQNGKNHHQFVNADGVRVNASLSPSDRNAWKNTIRDMERISGMKLERHKMGKTHFKRQIRSDMHQSPEEMRVSLDVDNLLARASAVRAEFQELCLTPNRTTVIRARRLLAEYEEFRQQLAVHHRILDPITR